MNEFISKHSIKIQLGVLITLILFVITSMFWLSGYLYKVEANELNINSFKVSVEKIPVIENNLNYIQRDIAEIKSDMKLLLKSK